MEHVAAIIWTRITRTLQVISWGSLECITADNFPKFNSGRSRQSEAQSTSSAQALTFPPQARKALAGLQTRRSGRDRRGGGAGSGPEVRTCPSGAPVPAGSPGLLGQPGDPGIDRPGIPAQPRDPSTSRGSPEGAALPVQTGALRAAADPGRAGVSPASRASAGAGAARAAARDAVPLSPPSPPSRCSRFPRCPSVPLSPLSLCPAVPQLPPPLSAMPLQQGSARARQRTVLLVGIAVLLAALVLAVVLASLLTHGRHEVSPKMLKWKDRGTTKNLQEVILGRCYNYITAQHPELGWVEVWVGCQVMRPVSAPPAWVCRGREKPELSFVEKCTTNSVPQCWLFKETTRRGNKSNTNQNIIINGFYNFPNANWNKSWILAGLSTWRWSNLL